MYICHINMAAGYRGGERQTELLIRELANRGHQQRLVARRGSSLAPKCRDIASLDIVETGVNAVSVALAARRCDIVHAHEGRGPYAGLLARWLFHVPYVVTRRVVNPKRPGFLRRKAYGSAGAVAAISVAAGDAIAAAVEGLEYRLVPDAHASLEPDAEAVAALRQRYDGRLIIGNVSALEESKGPFTVLEAARLSAARHPEWLFLFCGGGPEEQAVRAAAAGAGNVEVAGFVDRVADYYPVFDIFLLPSFREAAGSSMLDAMVFGLPIVASNVGGIPEVLEDGINGRLVEAGDADALVAAIEQLQSDTAWVERVRAANVDKALDYSASAMADRYETIYASLA